MPTTADIRRFIMDIFDDEELTTLCFDYFAEVQNNFTSGMAKGDKALFFARCRSLTLYPRSGGALGVMTAG